MRRFIYVLMFLLLAFSGGSAFALGLGFYGTVQGGGGNWELENQSGVKFYDDDGDTGRLGIGFALDTAVARDKLFNYRLNVGLERFDIDFDNSGGTTGEFLGLAVDNTFGFGVMRTEKVRLWIGPRVRVALYGGDYDNDSTVDIGLFEFGVGGVFGANFHVGPTVSLGFETGVMFSGYGGEVETNFAGVEYDLTGSSANLFLNGVVMFRLRNDQY